MKKAMPVLSAVIVSALAADAHAAAYQVTEVTDGGAVTGKVTFSGEDPAPQIYKITKDNDVCGTGDRLVDYVKVNNGALTEVVVYLDKVKSGKAFAEPDGTAELDQKGCEFHPFLQVMVNGKALTALNSDPVAHNIHTYELIGRAKKTVINVSQPNEGDKYKKLIKLKRGTAMKVECDQHDFMHGFVFVAKSPYHAKVGKDGSFTIEDIPPGAYTVKAWHGTLGEKKTKVTVETGKTATVNFEFK